MTKRIVITEDFLAGLESGSPSDTTLALIQEIRSVWDRESRLQEHNSDLLLDLKSVKKEIDKMHREQKKPNHFHRIAAHLMHRRAVKEINQLGVIFILFVAMEQVKKQAFPVEIWNSVLCEELDFTTPTLCRVRDKCVDAGWLEYTNKGNRHPGLYHTVVPQN